MKEIPRTNYPGINATDRIFDCAGTLMKVRIICVYVIGEGKITNPRAVTLKISGSICDAAGKAIKRADGSYYISARSETVSLIDAPEIPDIDATVRSLINRCCDELALQSKKLDDLTRIQSAWESGQDKFFE